MINFNFLPSKLKIVTWAIMKKSKAPLTTTSATNGKKQGAIKKQKTQTIPSLIEAVAIGSGHHGTPMCLVVSMSHFKKLKGANRVFLTNANWRNVGGLIGLSLTFETAETKQMFIHGPPNVVCLAIFYITTACHEHHISSSRNFSKFENIEIVKEEITSEKFTDTAMTIEYIPLSNGADDDDDVGPVTVKKMKLSKEAVAINSVAYLCKPHAKQRSVDLAKCVELNVPAGPHLALLKEGHEVILPGTDRLIKPDDVLSKCEPNHCFLVVECSSLGHVRCVTSSPILSPYMNHDEKTSLSTLSPPPPPQSSSLSPLNLIIHFTHSSIMSHPLYQTWMKSFRNSENIHHMVLNEKSIDNFLSTTAASNVTTNTTTEDATTILLAAVAPVATANATAEEKFQYGMFPTSTTLTTLDTEAMFKLQTYFHLIHPFIFPSLPYQSLRKQQLSSENDFSIDSKIMSDNKNNMIKYAATNAKFIMRPVSESPFNFDQCISINPKSYVDELIEREDGLKEFLDEWRNKNNFNPPSPVSTNNPEILFLGTGSAVPNKYRNVSSVWLNLGNGKCFVMDAGENSYGQLLRHYGVKKGQGKLADLAGAFVSHLHADHHLGLIGFALERHNYMKSKQNNKNDVIVNGNDDRLIVIAPRALYRWYSSIHCDDIPILDSIEFIASESLHVGRRERAADDVVVVSPSYEKLLKLTGLKKIETVRVEHTQHPHGLVLHGGNDNDDDDDEKGSDNDNDNRGLSNDNDDDVKCGWKLVYSGDTMPSKNLIEAGRNCDVLIHEATFDANKEEEARDKKHCTSTQAIEVGRQMKASFTILTHFSQRYDKLPIFTDVFGDDVGVAFDNMRVTLKDLATLPKLVPAYKRILASEYYEMTQQLENKQFRKEFLATAATTVATKAAATLTTELNR
ncbi:hypothetical protein HELRODRAFT_189299 [Helobdella robusta]|uniref:ribonuclease Z n=1 Tax=Helobdella robusta TaxID=6412 RepID=T1FQX7_HELRO|nr:hypothetical protein HELRODRAFT_189299 [Helobdella robusta]ESN96581.1 hypothetical protein HELRODRAFT_189299 [Helobdella robusta]